MNALLACRGKTLALLGAACRRQLAVARPNSTNTESANNNEVDDGSNDAPNFEMDNPYTNAKKQCVLCKYGLELDYKNTRLISQFISSFTGRIYDKHITGLCDKQQESLREEIKKAIRCGLMPKQHKDVRFLKDPQLFDPFRPSRPHPY